MGSKPNVKISIADYRRVMEVKVLNDEQAKSVVKFVYPDYAESVDELESVNDEQIFHAQALLALLIDASWAFGWGKVVFDMANPYAPNSFGSAVYSFYHSAREHWTNHPKLVDISKLNRLKLYEMTRKKVEIHDTYWPEGWLIGDFAKRPVAYHVA